MKTVQKRKQQSMKTFSNDTVGVPRLGPAGLANSSEKVTPQMGCQLSFGMAEDDLYVDKKD
jgi:hypothetical protein